MNLSNFIKNLNKPGLDSQGTIGKWVIQTYSVHFGFLLHLQIL